MSSTYSTIHDNIKIKYSNEGYLPNWPYHMISEDEMCDAFISECIIDDSECRKDERTGQYTGSKFVSGSGFFFDNYPLLNDSLQQQYCDLVRILQYHLEQLKSYPKKLSEPYVLPDWVYTYLLGYAISVNSDLKDIHDLLTMLHIDNIDDIFTPEASELCYAVSYEWVNKEYASSGYIEVPVSPGSEEMRKISLRPPTMFGEPHVIKSMRLKNIDPNTDWGRYPGKLNK